MKPFHCRTLILLLLVFGGISQAQVPQKLHDYELIYRKEIVRINKKLNVKYLRALEDLQKRYTKKKNFEAAVKVKQEIERIRIYQAKNFQEIEVKLPEIGTPVSKRKEARDPNELSKWKGDSKLVRENGKIVAHEIVANPNGAKKIERTVSTDGMTKGLISIRYKGDPEFESKELKALEFRGYYSTGAFKFRKATVTFDGEWHEYLWPFNDIRNEKAIRFEIQVLPGKGTVFFEKIDMDFK